MIFNTQIPIQRQQAIERFKYLLKEKKRIAIIDKKPKRTMKQHRYAHLLFGWVSIHTGYTLEEVKQDIFKKHVNPDIFYEGEVDGVLKIERWRSINDPDTGELTIAIERFRNFSNNDLNLYLASPDDMASLQHYENELSKYESKVYL